MTDTDLLALVQGAIKSVSDHDMLCNCDTQPIASAVSLLDAIRNELLKRANINTPEPAEDTEITSARARLLALHPPIYDTDNMPPRRFYDFPQSGTAEGY